MQKRNVLNSPRLTELKKRRHQAILNKTFIFFLGLLAVFILAIYLSNLKSLKINGIEVAGNKITDAEMIKKAVADQIAGKYLWLFPKANIFFYPKNKIKNELQNEFKRLKDINLSIKDNKTLLVSVAEREANYIWCGTNLPLLGGGAGEGSEKCDFMDESGYLFDQAPYFSGEVYFKFYGPINNPLGSYFSKENFQQLILFKDILISLDLKPVALYLADAGEVDIFLSGGNTLSTDPKIILQADSDFQKVAENLQAALTTEPLSSKFKNNYSKLQYIDLRFDNKVYDKFE